MAAAEATHLQSLSSSQSCALQVALVAATFRRSAVDAALRRAGRLDVEIALGALTQAERLEARHL